jgi:fucose permease
MWNTRVAAPLNLVHFGYGFGAICANLLVRPFMTNKNSNIHPNIFNSTLSTSITTELYLDIRVPYLINGGLCILMGFGHLIFFLREQKDKAEKQQASPIFGLESILEISMGFLGGLCNCNYTVFKNENSFR